MTDGGQEDRVGKTRVLEYVLNEVLSFNDRSLRTRVTSSCAPPHNSQSGPLGTKHSVSDWAAALRKAAGASSI